MIRIREQPTSSAAVTKSSSRSDRKRPRTTRASSVQPISEMMIVITKKTRTMSQSLRDRRRQPHPQRNRRDRAQDLDHALDDRVDRAAEIARQAAEQRRPGPGSATTLTRPISSETWVAYISRDH